VSARKALHERRKAGVVGFERIRGNLPRQDEICPDRFHQDKQEHCPGYEAG
jgi:hypothetical protein